MLYTCQPNALISSADLDAANRGRVQAGDVLILDSSPVSVMAIEGIPGFAG